MEGVPRMPMLSVDPKVCVAPADFGPKMKQYITHNYQEDPDKYDKAITELDNLRENACKAVADVSGCKVLKKYFAQLHLLKSRFPMEQGDEVAIPFSWLDKFYDMPSPVTVEDIRFEMACVMHNIGAVHSSVGAADTRMSSEGMKSACTHFQCAVYAFQYLKEKMSASSFSADFDKSLLSWYCALMLAQAQECILEKSMVDNRKNSIVAKVAVQVADYYKQCLNNLDSAGLSELVGSSKCKVWKKFCHIKCTYYTAIGYLYMGQTADEQQKMGERLAWYEASAEKMAEATKLGQKETDTVKEPLKFTSDVVVVKRENAKKENDFIFHEKVPDLSTLPEIKGVPLVKGIEFNPLDPEISGPDIFGALVPLSVHQTSSLYSEEKAKLLRRTTQTVEEKDSELHSFLNSLQLEKLPVSRELASLPVPEGLLERSARFNDESDAVPNIIDAQERLTACYQESDTKLVDLEQRFCGLEKEMSTVYEKLPKNKQENFRNLLEKLSDMKSELDKYRKAHFQATESNKELQIAVAVHSENLKMLAAPLQELKKSLPAPPLQIATAPETLELKRLLDKVEQMRNQRKFLLDQLRDQVMKDDLTKLILSEKDVEAEDLFSKELKKYDEQIAILDQNMAAQGNILTALTEANAKYAILRRQTTEALQARDAKINSLIAAYDGYVDVKKKAEEGRQFYEKLLIGLNSVDDRIDSLESDWKQAKENLKREFREEEEKRIAEHKSIDTIQPSNTTGIPSPGHVVPSRGPRLKDYMEYYRGKKVTLPSSTGCSTLPVSPDLQTVSGLAPLQTNGASFVTPASSLSHLTHTGPTTDYTTAHYGYWNTASQPSSTVGYRLPADFVSSTAATSPAPTTYSTVDSRGPSTVFRAPFNTNTVVSSPSQLPLNQPAIGAETIAHPHYGTQTASNNPYPVSHPIIGVETSVHPASYANNPYPLNSGQLGYVAQNQKPGSANPYGYAKMGVVTDRNYQPFANVSHAWPEYNQTGANTYMTNQYSVPISPQAGQGQYRNAGAQCLAEIDAPVLGGSLPAPLQPSKVPEKPRTKQLTETEKELADVFG